MNKIDKPDFLIVGAAKSGTSSLHYYLQEHPQIYLHDFKELNFWHLYGHENKRAILKRVQYLPTTPEAYVELFNNASSGQMIGDISPSYLYYYEDTICNIKSLHKNWEDIKIIIILREPIEKIWSHYCFVKQERLDPDQLSLWSSLLSESERRCNTSYLPDLFYVDNTRYYMQVKAYLENFKHVKIVLYDDFKKDTRRIIDEVTKFIGVDDFKYKNINKKYNISAPPKEERNWVRAIRGSILSKIFPVHFKDYLIDLLKKEKKLTRREVKYLKKVFIPEIEALEDLINKDLSPWLKKYDRY